MTKCKKCGKKKLLRAGNPISLNEETKELIKTFRTNTENVWKNKLIIIHREEDIRPFEDKYNELNIQNQNISLEQAVYLIGTLSDSKRSTCIGELDPITQEDIQNDDPKNTTPVLANGRLYCYNTEGLIDWLDEKYYGLNSDYGPRPLTDPITKIEYSIDQFIYLKSVLGESLVSRERLRATAIANSNLPNLNLPNLTSLDLSLI